MIKIAIYGKGGIGKSTTTSNLSAALSQMGYRVMQIGCDPKADSTRNLLGGRIIPTVLGQIQEKGDELELEDIVFEGFGGVLCVESGGPTPGIGCAGLGIISAFNKLAELDAYEIYRPDIVLYDVLGDVVCGGFAVPMRQGYADHVLVVTSGENMAIHAAANIGLAVQGFAERGYAQLAGLILNRRDVRDEDAKVAELAGDLGCEVVGELPRDRAVTDAEERGLTLMEAEPESPMADAYRALADAIELRCGFGSGAAADAGSAAGIEGRRTC